MENEKQRRIAIIDNILSKGKYVSFQEIAVEINKVLKKVKFESPTSLDGTYGAVFRKDIQIIRDTLRNRVFGLTEEMLQISGGNRNRRYCYKEKGFSILPYLDYHFSVTDQKNLKQALNLLRSTLPSDVYNMVEFSLNSRVEYDYGSGERDIDYGENINLRGRQWLPIIYKVLNKRPIKIQYETFKGVKFDFQFHPYMLKQYNNRWFLFGRNESTENDYWNVPLDRIKGVKELKDEVFKSRPTNYMKYFDSFIGVSEKVWLGENGDENDRLYLSGVDVASKRMRIDIRVEGKGTWGRIKTKPLHISQTELDDGFNEIENCGRIRLDIIPNVEFYNKIMELGENVIVESPSCVREIVIERLNNTLGKYRNE